MHPIPSAQQPRTQRKRYRVQFSIGRFMAVIALFAIALGVMPSAIGAVCASVLFGGYFYVFSKMATGPRLPLRYSRLAGIEKHVLGKLEGDSRDFDELWNLSGAKPAEGAVFIGDECTTLPGDLSRRNRASRDRSERKRTRRRRR